MLPLMREGGRMAGGGSERKTILVGLALALILGVAVYLRLWTIDYTLSSDDTERLRQFDLANREAMDESAEWRRMFDSEAEKASKCNAELALMKESSSGNGNAFTLNQKLESLHKENAALLSEIETLKQELEASRLKCRSREAPR
ncbi:Acyl-CoA-binding domain protein [Hirschfeldia incana]|nr:Acyl-CoA-binding domain protein [Hirschfeldia incana]